MGYLLSVFGTPTTSDAIRHATVIVLAAVSALVGDSAFAKSGRPTVTFVSECACQE
jgi:hypothetical protein